MSCAVTRIEQICAKGYSYHMNECDDFIMCAISISEMEMNVCIFDTFFAKLVRDEEKISSAKFK